MAIKEQTQWAQRTITAISGAAVLSQASARDVARHAVRDLLAASAGNQETALAAIRAIDDFAVRRRLLEVFRRCSVEQSENFSSELFFKKGDFSDKTYADAFDADLLALWRQSGRDQANVMRLISLYPLVIRNRIMKRLVSPEFAKKRRIRYGVGTVLNGDGPVSAHMINIIALLIFLALLALILS